MLPALFRCGRLWLALLLALGQGAAAQPGGGFRLARRGSVRVPFTTPRNLMVVQVRLNGRGPYNFLLDTGVGVSLITNAALADSLHLGRGAQYGIRGVGGESGQLRAFETLPVRTELRGVLAPALTWLVLSDDVLDLSGFAGMRIEGILGGELFRSLVVTVDPKLNIITFSDPGRYQAPRGRRWTTVPLRLEHDKAYLTAEVEQLATASTAAGPPLPLQLVLDTGAGHALSLETTADSRLQLPPTHLRADLGRGLSGLVSGYLGRVAAVRLGCYRLPLVITSFPDSSQVRQRLTLAEKNYRQGNLGFEVLKRFTFVIDYPHQRLLLRPTQLLRDPFEHDMCGLDLLALAPNFRRYLVQRVAPDSPAAKAGIEVEEELMMVNFIPVDTLTLGSLNALLHSQDGRVLLLVLRRPDGELHPVKVKLKRLI